MGCCRMKQCTPLVCICVALNEKVCFIFHCFFSHFQAKWAVPLVCWDWSWSVISTPLYLQGMAACAEAAQTPSHSRILYLKQIWLKVEITLELPVGSEFVPTSIPSARVIPQIGIPLLQKTVTHSLANLTQKLSTVVKGLGLVEHICKS